MNSLSGRVALVTGSSRGIGAAIARLFAWQGAKVALHGRDTAALSAVALEIESSGGAAMQVVADVTNFAMARSSTRCLNLQRMLARRPRERFGVVSSMQSREYRQGYTEPDRINPQELGEDSPSSVISSGAPCPAEFPLPL